MQNEETIMQGTEAGAQEKSSDVGAENASGTAAGETSTEKGSGDVKTEKKLTGAEMLRAALSGRKTSSGNSGEGASSAESGTQEMNADGKKAGTDAGNTAEGTEKKEQTKEENAAFAAIRRKAEAEAAAKINAEKESTKALISSLGLVDPVTGKPVTDIDTMKAYRDHRGQADVTAAAKKAGISEDQLKEIIDRHPDVLKAKEQEREMQKQLEEAEHKRLDAQLQTDIAEIAKLNPSVKTFDDIRKLDKYQQIYDGVKHGMTMYDSYRIAYYDELMTAGRQAAAQEARNAVTGKAHLQSTQQTGTGEKEIPAKDMEILRRRMPKKTDAELRDLYRRTH